MPEILDLTMDQFDARLEDVFVIHNQFQGDGKGRITRDADAIRRRFEEAGLQAPATISP